MSCTVPSVSNPTTAVDKSFVEPLQLHGLTHSAVLSSSSVAKHPATLVASPSVSDHIFTPGVGSPEVRLQYIPGTSLVIKAQSLTGGESAGELLHQGQQNNTTERIRATEQASISTWIKNKKYQR